MAQAIRKQKSEGRQRMLAPLFESGRLKVEQMTPEEAAAYERARRDSGSPTAALRRSFEDLDRFAQSSPTPKITGDEP